MANIKSQIKRNLTNEKARISNKIIKSQVKNAIKKFKLAIKNNDKNINEFKNKAISLIDKSISKGVYHKNKGNNLKSKIMTY